MITINYISGVISWECSRKKSTSKKSVPSDTIMSKIIVERLSVSETEQAVQAISEYAKLISKREEVQSIAAAVDAIVGFMKMLKGDLFVSGNSLKERLSIEIADDIIDGSLSKEVAEHIIPKLSGPTFLSFSKEILESACNDLDSHIQDINDRGLKIISENRKELIEQMIDKDIIMQALNEQLVQQQKEITSIEKTLFSTNNSLAAAIEENRKIHDLITEKENLITDIAKEKGALKKQLKTKIEENEMLKDKLSKFLMVAKDIDGDNIPDVIDERSKKDWIEEIASKNDTDDKKNSI